MNAGKPFLIACAIIGVLYGVLYMLAYPMMADRRRFEKIIALSKSPTPSVETVYYGRYDGVCAKFDHEVDDEFFKKNWNRKEVTHYTGTPERKEKGYFRKREITYKIDENNYSREISFVRFGECGEDPKEKFGCFCIFVQRTPSWEMVTYKDGSEKNCLNPLDRGISIRKMVKTKSSGTFCRGRDKYTGEFIGRVYYSEQSYFDTKEKPMLNSDGVARETCRKWDRGKALEFRYFGVHGEPVRFRGMMEQWRIFCDDAGNLKRIELLTTEEKLEDVKKSGYVFSIIEPQGESVILKNVQGKETGKLSILEFRKLYDSLWGDNGKPRYLY